MKAHFWHQLGKGWVGKVHLFLQPASKNTQQLKPGVGPGFLKRNATVEKKTLPRFPGSSFGSIGSHLESNEVGARAQLPPLILCTGDKQASGF